MSANIIVVGSLNMDLVMRMPRVPVGGETLTGHDFATLPGGKGANQAVASARMGGRVAMVGRLGADSNGAALRATLDAEGIATAHVSNIATAASGVAMIWVEDDGQNRIALAPGANGSLGPAEVDAAAADIAAAALLIVQFEVPMPAVLAAVGHARRAGVKVLLNPAPAAPLPAALWPQVDILVLNESEASAVSGVVVGDVASAVVAGETLRARGPSQVLVTLGAQGVVVVDGAGSRHAAAHQVVAVDTTAAGDTFIGALAVALCEGQSLDAAVALGQAASALCVTRAGAQASIPYRRELSA